ncbi:MAG: hypothetical protein RML94_00110 [Bacteroidia bacterium]|nr:hypothetical protein [Bacteroidia bacterium]
MPRYKIKSYKNLSEEFVIFFNQKVEKQGLSREYKCKKFTQIVYEFIMTHPEMKEVKKFFETHHIDFQKMHHTVEELAQSLIEHFSNGNVSYIPSMGYYGIYVKKNKPKFYSRDMRVSHYKIKKGILKPCFHLCTILPTWNVYIKTFFNLLFHPILRS